MDSQFNWFTNICNLATLLGFFITLVGFIITLVQINRVRKQVTIAESAVKRMVNNSNREQLELIKNTLMDQHGKLVQIQARYDRKGIKWTEIVKKTDDIQLVVLDCLHKLPPIYEKDLSDLLHNTVSSLALFTKEEPKEESDESNIRISDAEIALYSSINVIKKMIELNQKEELKELVE